MISRSTASQYYWMKYFSKPKLQFPIIVKLSPPQCHNSDRTELCNHLDRIDQNRPTPENANLETFAISAFLTAIDKSRKSRKFEYNI